MFKSSEEFNTALVSLCSSYRPKNEFIPEGPSSVRCAEPTIKCVVWPENVWTTTYQPMLVQDLTSVLRVGEIGFDIKDGSYRIGDGATAYSELAINRRPE
jgi:hypothetical protein